MAPNLLFQVCLRYIRTLFSLKSLRIAFCALKFGSPAISCIGGRNKGQISHLLHPIVLLIVVSSLLLYNYMWLGLTFNSHSLVLFLLKHFQNSWNVYWLLFEVWPSFSIAEWLLTILLRQPRNNPPVFYSALYFKSVFTYTISIWIFKVCMRF